MNSDAAAVLLHAPMDGWLCSLAEVPDPVFAERMMGDGIAIDPLAGELVAPCDGVVVQVAPTAHAVTVRASNGAEILIHIGLDTVALGGAGFQADVSTGQEVRRGDRLLSFDLDAVALAATSLITPIIVTNSEGFTFTAEALDRPVRQGEPIATIDGHGQFAAAVSMDRVEAVSAEIEVPLAHGIHARPAARIAACVKKHSAEVKLRAHGREANGRSPVALMSLGVRSGDRIEIVASGADADAVTHALLSLISSGMGEEGAAPVTAIAQPSPAHAAAPNELTGVCAAPGLAVGPAAHLRVRDSEVPEEGEGSVAEREALARATASVRRSLTALAASGRSPAAGIAAAHIELLEDEDLALEAAQHIDQGKSAGFAWRSAIRRSSERLRATGNPLLQERTDDLLDLERQVIGTILGDHAPPPLEIPKGSILLAHELLPSQLTALLQSRVAGLCTAGGGPTSHAAIMAAAAGLPMLVAAGDRISSIADGATLLLDSTNGRLVVEPSDAERIAADEKVRDARLRRSAERADALADCRTADGTRIHVFANLASAAEAAEAVEAGAEGCGLLRTEFLFHDRETAPTEDEQLAAYQAVADALDGRPLIVRTLDVGGDKPLAYLPIPREDNPALGLRGIRTSLWKPELLDEQLRAVLRVQPPGRCKIMLPMVVALDELRTARARLDTAARAVGFEGSAELGIMIETPAAALLADQLAAEADFFSVGSNDLTQYALAMDRGNPLVAAQVDAFHPAVLRLIATAARGARAHGREIGMCGGMASDPSGAVILVGLGLTELSVTASAVAPVKARLRSVTVEQCRAIAARALEETSPQSVRHLITDALAQSGPIA